MRDWRPTLVLALVVAGCSAGTTGDWGPLAVADERGGGDALIHGRIHITDDCVFLEEQGDEVLIVWPAGRTTWDPASQSITFENLDGARITVSDGNRVVMGGGGSSLAEDGNSNEDWVSSIDWVDRPSNQCLRELRWSVAELNIPQ